MSLKHRRVGFHGIRLAGEKGGVRMNIKQILRQAGLVVVGENITTHVGGWWHEYNVKFTTENIQEKLEHVPANRYEIDLFATHTVIVTEVGFDGHGDLYVVLETPDGDTFDVLPNYECPEENTGNNRSRPF